MYDDNDNSTGKPEKYTKEQFQKMEKERFATEDRENAKRDKVKQNSLFGDDLQDNPNKVEMDKRAAKAQEDKAAAREAKKVAKAEKGDAFKQASMISPSGNTTAAGRGTAYGGGDLEKGMQGGRMKKPSYAKGGKVSSASKRADGIAIRGKTRA